MALVCRAAVNRYEAGAAAASIARVMRIKIGKQGKRQRQRRALTSKYKT